MISMKAQVGLYSWGNEFFSSVIEAEVQARANWNEENPPITNNPQDQLLSQTLSARPRAVTPTGTTFQCLPLIPGNICPE